MPVERPHRSGAQRVGRAPAVSNPDPQHIEGVEGADHMHRTRRARNSSLNLEEETVPPFTSAQYLAIAERKMGEAKGAARHRKELEATAQDGWFSPSGLQRPRRLKNRPRCLNKPRSRN